MVTMTMAPMPALPMSSMVTMSFRDASNKQSREKMMKNIIKSVWLNLLAGLGMSIAVSANAAVPTISEVDKLIASDAAVLDYMGYSVAVDGDTAFIGAYGDDDLGNESGAVYVFTRDANGVWTQQQKLVGSDTVADDRFGYALVLEGDTAVIGMESWDFFEPPMGAAYVFTRDTNGVWSEIQKITAFDGVEGDYFGQSLAMNGDTLTVGSHGDDTVAANAGAVYVYTRDATGQYSFQQKLFASNGTDNDWFGRSLDVEGDTAIISSWGYDLIDGDVVFIGYAYVFEPDANGVWTETQMLDPGYDAGADTYGRSVAISGNTIAVSAERDDTADVDAGAVYIFNRDDTGAWNKAQLLSASDGGAYDSFGYDIDLEGDNLVVGAYSDDENGDAVGSAYLFKRDVNGIWSQFIKMAASDAMDYDYLGVSVSISGATVIAGAYLSDVNGDSAGATYVFNVEPAAEADIVVAPGIVDFGEVMVGLSPDLPVNVTNFGMTDLSLNDISVANGADYSQVNDCPATLLPLQSCQVTVTFAPSADGVSTDELVVASSDVDEPTATATLTGAGTTLLPDLVVSNVSLPRSIKANKTTDMDVTISNEGSADAPAGYWVLLYLNDLMIGSEWISTELAQGASLTFTTTTVIPDLSTGTYQLKAVIDSEDYILELDETNNTWTKSVRVR